MRTLLLLAGAALFGGPAVAQGPAPGPAPALSAEQEARYQHQIDELRCLVCQNQTIAESNAPLAADLRDEVRAQIAAGKGDREIRVYLTDRYGDFVLYRPPLKWRTAVLWFGPLLLLAVALAAALAHVRRSQRQTAAPDADPEALKRLLEDHR